MAFALAVLAVLATLAPEQAAAQTETTFISNTGQTKNSTSGNPRATAFTTGTGTYTLSSVAIAVTSTSSGIPAVQIYRDTGGNPGTLVATMTNPASVVNSAINVFTAPANTTLASGTYWLVTSNSAHAFGTGFRVDVRANTDLDSGTAAGWSIGNALWRTNIADAWDPSGNRIQFQIRGTEQTTTTNTPPTVANAIPDRTATAGTAFSYAFPDNTFSDADTGDTLTYTATKGDGTALPSWLSFDAATRTFSGTPMAADVGTVTVKVTADDSNGGTVSDEFDIVVSAAANTAPTVANAIPDQTATAGTAFSYAFPENTFNDTDTGDTLSYAATQADGAALPTWLVFTAGTRTFAGTPAATDVGTVSVKVTASDGNGGSVSDEFDITVSAAPTMPTAPVTTLVSNTAQTVATSSSSQFVAQSFDTGSNDGGYTVTNVQIHLSNVRSRPTSVKIRENNNGIPGEIVATLTSPVPLISASLNTFTAPANTALDASSTYWISVNEGETGASSSRVAFSQTRSPDDTGLTGWSIGDTRKWRTSETAAWRDSSNILILAINGTANAPSNAPTNTPPTVANAIPDRTATAGTAFSYAFPDTTFNDADTGDTLSYAATQADGAALPTWLVFTAGTRTFAGTPAASDVGTVSVKVTASDGNGASVSDEFDIVVSADTTPPTLTSATVLQAGDNIILQFSEPVARTSAALPQASDFTVTASGIVHSISGIEDPGQADQIVISVGIDIHQGQTVVLTYTDPSAGNDARAVQDTTGNDAANFTTGMNSVAAVTNNSEIAPITPGAPTGLTATASGTDTINLSWTAPVIYGGRVITGYKIEVSIDSGTDWTDLVADTTSTDTAYDHTGLAAGTTRHYRVSAINSIGAGTASDVVNATTGNTAPTVANAIPDRTATAGTAFSYAFPANTFNDTDTGDTLSYAATQADGAALPTWLAFTAGTRTFAGTPAATDVGTVSVKVTASDGHGGSVSDEFDITVEADTTPPTLTNAQVLSQGTRVVLTFSESLQTSNPPPASAFAVTADGTALTVSSLVLSGSRPLISLAISPLITVGEAVVVTYSDPTGGDDAVAIQDVAGNDAATFTTGMNGVPAVTNDSILTNSSPTVANAIPDRTATAGTAFSYAFPANTFNDTDTGDTLSYTATKADGTALPTWLAFTAGTRTFAGTPAASDVGTVSVKVTASDGNGASVSDEFDIVVSADTTPPTLTSATVLQAGDNIILQFSEPVARTSAALPQASDFTVTASGIVHSISGIEDPGQADQIVISVGIDIHQGQTVVLTYTDPSAGNDARAVQDTTGNDAANFTTGMNSVAAVTNNSEIAPITPGAPTGLTATASGTDTINLSWTAPVIYGGRVITGYKIEVSIDSGTDWTDLVADTTSTDTAYDHTGLAAGTTRHYRVSAINSIGAGTASDVVNATTGNTAPTVANAIPDRTATAGTAFSYAFPENTFNDTDTGQTLSYAATQADGAALPTWLVFTAGTRTFAGTPAATDVGTVSVKVTASDGHGGSVSDEFDITVSAAPTMPTAVGSLVSNLGQTPHSGSLPLNSWDVVQGFETGASGYTLVSVDLRLNRQSGGSSIDVPSVKLMQGTKTATGVTLTGQPVTLTAEVAQVTSTTGENYTFTAPSGATLSASTRYFVVVERVGTRVQWMTTASTGEDAPPASAAGWSIDDERWRRSASSTGNFTNKVTRSQLLRVNGNANASSDTTAPVLATTEDPAVLAADGVTLTLTYNEALNEASVPGASAFTVQATPMGASEATLALAATDPVAVTGRTVVLTLAAPVAHNDDSLKVTYTKPTGATDAVLEDAAGNDAASLPDRAVTNNSTVERVSIEAVYPDASPLFAHPEFKVTRSNVDAANALDVTIEFTQDDTWLSSVTGTIAIPAGATAKTETFTTYYSGNTSGDLVATVAAGEGYVAAVAPANAATVAFKVPATGSLVTVAIQPLAFSVDEGDPARFVLVSTTATGVAQPRDRGRTTRGAVAFVTASGTATINKDYKHRSVNEVVGGSNWTAANGGYVSTQTVEVETLEDEEYEADETFRGYLDSTPGVTTAITPSGSRATVTILDDETPADLRVSGVAVTSTPAAGTIYGAGEGIDITVSIAGVVAVDATGGTPRFAFALGDATPRHAAYASGSGTRDLVFTYTVAAGDEDHDGLSWPADSVELNGGTVKFMHTDPAERIDAILTHDAQTALPDHAVDAKAPGPVEAHAAGTMVVLTFSEDLAPAASLANTAFAVKKTPAGGSETTLTLASTAPAISGKTVTLTLDTASAVVATDTEVKVSYMTEAGSANKLVDASGNETANFTDEPVVNQLAETDPPVLQTASIDGDELVLTYDEPLDTNSVAAAGDFAVRVSGSPRGVNTVAVSGAVLTLTLASEVDNSDTVTVSYTVGTHPIRDIARNEAAGFMNRAVDNTTVSAPDAPRAVSASPGNAAVRLSWEAPEDSGGAAIVRYEVRHAEGASVPPATAWTAVPDGEDAGTDAADERTVEVSGLTNGTSYRFEVRAYNGTHFGPEVAVDATPELGPALDPGAPHNLRALAGDSAVSLHWSPPLDTGNRPIIRYEVRHGAGASVPSGTGWTDVGRSFTHTVGNLNNDVAYAFEVRAVNSADLTGPAALAQATPMEDADAPSAVRGLRANARSGEVLLYWRAPARSGLTAIARYEYRYAPGDTVPSMAPWLAVPSQSGTARTVGGLDNTVRYTFEVRAVNATEAGAAAQVRATPTAAATTTRAPARPGTLTAESGEPYVTRADSAPEKREAYVDVTLRWTVPGDDGNDYIVRYEYRYAKGTGVPSQTPWRVIGSGALEVQVKALEAGVRYAFELRAVTASGPGAAVRTGLTTKRYAGAAVTLSVSGTAREGRAFNLGASRNRTQGETYVIFEIKDEAFANRVFYARADFADGQSRASTTYTPAYDSKRPTQRRFTVRIGAVPDASYTIDARKVSVTVQDNDAGLRVADAEAREGPGAKLEFTVTLSRTLDRDVTVTYATGGGTATAGQDYTAASGTLTVPAGSRERVIEVTVIDDSIDDDGETLTLTLSNASGAVIDDAMATGTIRNSDPLPQAWLARFGRTATDHTIDAIYRRVQATGPGAQPDAHLTVGGRRIDPLITRLRRAGGPADSKTTGPADSKTTGPAHGGPGAAHGKTTGPAHGGPGAAHGSAADGSTAPDTTLDDETAHASAPGSNNPVGRHEGSPTGGGAGSRDASVPARSAKGAAPANTGVLADEPAWARMDRLRKELSGGRLFAGARAWPVSREPQSAGLPSARMPSATMPTAGPGSEAPSAPAAQEALPIRRDGEGDGPEWVSVLDTIAGVAGDARWARLYRQGRTLAGEARRFTLRDALMGSSFFYSPTPGPEGEAPGPLGRWSAWGVTAATRFNGAEDELSVAGDVATATLGFDTQRDRWMAGLALSYSEGAGAYTHPDTAGGALESTLTQLAPYARFTLNERTALWGTFGYGTGQLTLSPELAGQAVGAQAPGALQPLVADMSGTMAAFGGRTELSRRLSGGAAFTLAAVSDARYSRTVSEATEGLSGAVGATSRVRLMLEGRGAVSLGNGALLTPTLQAGLRHDGGDAETGAGLEVAAGLGYSAGPMTLQINGRGLLAHQDAAYVEWGRSASLTYRARSDGQGFSVTMRSAWGQTENGIEAMWAQTHASRLANGTSPVNGARRVQAEVAWGLLGRKSRVLWTPFVAAQSGDAGAQALRLGTKFTAGPHARADLQIAREAAAFGRTHEASALRSRGAPGGYAITLRGSILW